VADILPVPAGDAANPDGPIVGTSCALTELLVLADRAAASQAAVLLTGEAGTGKGLIAAYIHARSARRLRPFVRIDCAAANEAVLESECFGHSTGSFTGAQGRTIGKLELADSGTALIRDINCAGMATQLRLLRLLETGNVQPIGAAGPEKRFDVRLIATATTNLAHLARARTFREDLLCRLRVGHIHVPALRERTDDIAPLVAHTIAKTGRAVRFSDEALALLAAYHWPGNVRELQSTVEHLVWMSGVTLIDVAHLPPMFRTPGLRVVSIAERRRQLADDLFAALVGRTLSFWDGLYPLFLSRDITRHDLRQLISRGLHATAGSYRTLVPLFGMEPREYKRLLNFLAAHDCSVDPRPFRKRTADPPASGSIRVAVIGTRRSVGETRRVRTPAQS
jgi:two-component system, NtrC family, response regulator